MKVKRDLSTPENREFWTMSEEAKAVRQWPWWKRAGVSNRGRPGWIPLPLPELPGIFRTLKAELAAYHVKGDEPAYLATDLHGTDLNPGAPLALNDPHLLGPFKTLLFVRITVHCIETGKLMPLPFTFGSPEALEGEEFTTWFRHRLRLMLQHEVDEAV